jgi:ABC-type molybdate transport system substrate-binding protein
VQRVRSGEAFDVVIATSSQIADLEKQGLVAEGTKRDLAKVGIGVYVKKAAMKPDVSTVERFKQALLKANAIAYIDPASGGASGIYVLGLLTRLGIADEMKPKTRSPKQSPIRIAGHFSLFLDILDDKLAEVTCDLPQAGRPLRNPVCRRSAT